MSSHHIIRENQEPALLFNSIDSLGSEYLGQLLEWSPSVLTNDYFVDFLLVERIKVDVVFGGERTLYEQDSIKKVGVSQSFLQDALLYLVSNNYKAVNIISDKVEEVFFEFSRLINIVVFVEGIRYVFVKGHYKKWKPKGEVIMVKEKYLKSLVGLHRIKADEFVSVSDGFVHLEFNSEGFVSIGEVL
ncbi:thiamine diphosphokinase [Sphingobacterium sp. UT-1RO-CII-1]|uniref:thiamine diphosphokinase n=1 Tax=Sphingobacterium sp. UT-1RO-CII-1 TaxID=2995225 RepID=UPI00227BA513|nr:thiamine diphosphokinase [Sphingobacterium sp. UT-1RO-CII-1]MCY4778696.1 thiamine diphosphokinase [Sphingobacterium sp. UT-1RO-CII-1]